MPSEEMLMQGMHKEEFVLVSAVIKVGVVHVGGE
jgi:hypothetical protein